jgi:hypothetical protein
VLRVVLPPPHHSIVGSVAAGRHGAKQQRPIKRWCAMPLSVDSTYGGRCSVGCGDRTFGDPVGGCKACPANANRATGGFAVFPGLTSTAGALGPCVCDSGYLAINFPNATLQRCVLDCPAGYYVDATGAVAAEHMHACIAGQSQRCRSGSAYPLAGTGFYQEADWQGTLGKRTRQRTGMPQARSVWRAPPAATTSTPTAAHAARARRAAIGTQQAPPCPPACAAATAPPPASWMRRTSALAVGGAIMANHLCTCMAPVSSLLGSCWGSQPSQMRPTHLYVCRSVPMELLWPSGAHCGCINHMHRMWHERNQ